jgi:hypothetical protein
MNGITIEENLNKCAERCNKLLDLGYVIFSPITHSHQLDILQEREPQFWYHQDLEILRKLDGIILCPGWKESKGCRREYHEAIEYDKKVLFYEDLIKK